MKKYIVLLTLCFSVCSFAQIVTFPDANFKSKLIALGVDTNNDTEIDVNEALVVNNLDVSFSNISSLVGIEEFVNLQILNCQNNLITTLNITQNVNLITLNCVENQLTSIDLSQNSNLQTFYCNTNQLTSLDLTQNPNLVNLFCKDNQLNSLNISQNQNLQSLNCSNNLLSTINVSQNANLFVLNAAFNQLTSLDISQNTNLQALHCTSNQLTNIDVSTNSSLTTIICGANQFTALDFSQNINLDQLDVSNNSQLTNLFIKNGRIESNITLVNNPNLVYICTDSNQVNLVQSLAGSTTVVNTYCSFTPGGNFNTINGTIKFDQVGDGCDATDNVIPYVQFEVQSTNDQIDVSSNALGEYATYGMVGSYLVTPIIENPSWFLISPENATVTFDNTNNNFVTQNFCVTPADIHADATIVITPLNQPVPNTNVTYQIVFRNKGTQPLFGGILLNYDDGALDFVSSTVLPDNQVSGQLNWSYIDLLPFETRSFLVTFDVGNFVPLDYVLQLTAQITTSLTDEIPLDNQFLYKRKVIPSSNSNTLTCLQGEIVPISLIGEYLDYAVDFENTGLAQIENAVIKFQIDPTMFDPNSMQIQESTGNTFLRKNGNVVEVILQQLNIDTGGHGNVLLKIKSQSTLQEGDSVINIANIYFDYNAPISTNEAETTFGILNNTNFPFDASIVIFPNPTNSILTINCNSSIKTIELYDVQGRLLQTQIVDNTTVSLDISNKTNGIYFVKITSEKGVKVEKISKE